jgi:DNA repair protein RecO (recombination protein O)
MEERATGIILRTRPLTETSLIAVWLTAEQGRVSTVAKGALRAKSPFRGKIDLFYESELTFSRSRRSELHTLKELRVLNTHSRLREELGYVQQASYAAALIEQTTETDTPLPGLYKVFVDFIVALPLNPPEQKTIFAFEAKVLQDLGLQPEVEESTLGPGTRRIFQRLMHDEWSALKGLRLSEAQEIELAQYLHGYLIFHLGKFPKSRAGALHPS